MRWSELELRAKIWTIPKERAKTGEGHTVPLSSQAVAVLDGVPRIVESPFVFTTTGDTAISGFSKAKAEIDRMSPPKMPPWRLHDLRRTVATGLAKLGIDLPVIEKVLNHSSGSFAGVVDRCRDKQTGTLAPWAQRIVDSAKDIGAYVEVTASGEGVRIIGVVTGEPVHRKLQTEDGGSVECYRKATRYITMSFWQISESETLPNVDALIDRITAQYGPKKTNKTEKTQKTQKTDEDIPVETLSVIQHGAAEGRRSEAFMGVVAELKRCGLTVDDIEALLSKHPNRIAAKYDGRLRAEVERCFDKVTISAPGDWPDINLATGKATKTYSNALTAIEHLGITCRYDEFHDRMLVGGHEIEQYAGELTDAAVAAVRQLIIDTYGFDAGKDHVHDAASWLCIKNRFDPVRDYLDELNWDGKPRVDTWLTTYLGVEDSDLHRAQGRLTLVAAVRRARKPGCKFDHILTLEGEENKLKSTLIEVLAGGPQNFSDNTILSASEKEQQELIRGVWLYELAELSGMRRADGERLKAFITRTYDRARPAYGRRRQDLPRRCVFIATTNEDDYLKSPTGNRRFWPVRITTVDIDALRRDRDQLWAEAAMIEASGEVLALPKELWGEASAAQEERREHDPWDDALTTVRGALYSSTSDGQSEQEWIRACHVLAHLGITSDRATSETQANRASHEAARLEPGQALLRRRNTGARILAPESLETAVLSAFSVSRHFAAGAITRAFT
jgi:hypothetical protein